MKVAYLQHGFGYGGAVTSLYLLIRAVGTSLQEKHVFSNSVGNDEIRKKFEDMGCIVKRVWLAQIHNNTTGRTPLLPFAVKAAIPVGSLLRAVRDADPDILHVNTTVFPQVLAPVRRELRAKVVVHVRETLPRYGLGTVRRYMVDRIHRNADRIIAITDLEAEPFRGHPGLHVLPNPFDFAEAGTVTAGAFRKSWGIPETCVLVGMIGQFHRLKGHLDFLRALAILKARAVRGESLKFVLIGVDLEARSRKERFLRSFGGKTYADEVYALIGKENLAGDVVVVPPTLRFLEILGDLDILVRPSLLGDPWGRDVIEGMALGKPVVATGTSEFYLKDGATGYLVPPRRPDRIAERILELVRDPGRGRAMGEEGRRKIRGMCDLEEYGSRIRSIYENLV
jgi:glycosyltransferase involved in cell wall biosynthesis